MIYVLLFGSYFYIKRKYMPQVNEGSKARKSWPVFRRSAKERAKLNAASEILASKVADKRT